MAYTNQQAATSKAALEQAKIRIDSALAAFVSNPIPSAFSIAQQKQSAIKILVESLLLEGAALED